MAIAWYQVRGHFAGITFWLIALVTQAVGAILLVLRGLVPDLISIVLANGIIQAGVIILYIGLARFTGKKVWQVHNYILLAIFISIQAYYTFIQPDLLARIINVSVATAAFSFQCFWLLMRRVDPPMHQTTRFVGIAFGCMVIVSLIRIVLMFTSPLQSNDYFKADIPETLVLILYAALAIIITFGLILIASSRLWRELRESHQKYESLVENLNSGVAVYKAVDDGQDFVFIDFNYAGERISNIRRQEIMGQRLLEVFPRIREFGLFEVLQRVWRTGKSEHFPITKYQDKRISGWRDNYIYKLPSGEIVAIYDDVTDRKLAEQNLKINETKYRTLFEILPLGVTISDNVGNIIESNKEAERLLGLSAEEQTRRQIDGKEWQIVRTDGSLMPADEYASVRALKENRLIENVEMGIMKEAGMITWVNVTAAPIPLPGYGVAITFGDITKHRTATDELEYSHQELRNLSRHLQTLREEERAIVAREIHDELGQALTALKMDLAWLSKRLPEDNELLLNKTESMLKVIGATVQKVRRISTNLRPEMLDDLGLVAAMEWLAGEFNERIGIQLRVTVEPKDIDVGKDLSTAIFRIFQETLTNIARHAEATRVTVSLREKAGMLVLRVRDNGLGIMQEKMTSLKSIGIIGMRERAFALGGKFEIKGVPGKGTTVIVCIPVRGVGVEL